MHAVGDQWYAQDCQWRGVSIGQEVPSEYEGNNDEAERSEQPAEGCEFLIVLKFPVEPYGKGKDECVAHLDKAVEGVAYQAPGEDGLVAILAPLRVHNVLADNGGSLVELATQCV